MSHDLLVSCEETRTDDRATRPLEAEAERILRELAYVLHLTRRVRAEIDSGVRQSY